MEYKNDTMNCPQNATSRITELDFGKLHVSVQRVFSDTSTETVVDKVRKLILQHADDPHWISPQAEAALLRLPPDPLEEQQELSETQLAIAEQKREYGCDEGGASGEETTGNKKQKDKFCPRA